MTIATVSPIDAIIARIAERAATTQAVAAARPMAFADMLEQGIASTSGKLAEADRLIARAAIDDSVPLHQVTYAIEQARISFELMIQVRNRLIEAAQQFSSMQL